MLQIQEASKGPSWVEMEDEEASALKEASQVGSWNTLNVVHVLLEFLKIIRLKEYAYKPKVGASPHLGEFTGNYVPF